LVLFVGTLWVQTANGTVVINEVVPDPDGADAGNEWVELYNDGAAEVDLGGWVIERAKSSWGARYTFSAGVLLPPGSYLVVGGEFVAAADIPLGSGSTFDLGNAGTSGDGIRLVDDSGAVRDVIIYGPNNNDALLDESGSVVTSTAPKPASGRSLSRIPDGADTDDNGVDIQLVSELTPGSANTGGDTGEVPPECDSSSQVVINEFLANPNGSDTGNEWVEIYNASAATLDISGWRLAGGTSSFNTAAVIPADTFIESDSFLLIGQSSAVSGALVVSGLTMGNASNADAVQLQDCWGDVMDTVVYGSPNSDEWLDDDGLIASSLAEKPEDGKSLARKLDGQDTQQSGVDFQVAPFPTPGVRNDSPAEDCGAAESSVVINEFLVNPSGSDDGFEWVELYNAGTQSVALQGWGLQKASNGTSGYSNIATIESELSIGPGAFVSIGGELVTGTDVQVAKLGLNNGSNGDGIRLVDCLGYAADTVVYGPNNTDEVTGDGDTVANSLAPEPSDDLVLARVQDGYDTDASGVDFAAGLEGTMGQPNPEREPVVCEPSPGGVLVNEILVDPSGDDQGFEWFELYNSSDSDISVAGWWVAMAGQYDQIEDTDFRFGGGVVVPAKGFLLVGGAEVESADVVGSFSMGNGSGGDGFLLYDCEDALLDVVVYGSDNTDGIPNEEGIPRDPVGAPGNDESVARRVDGEDTQEVADWYIDHSPTPGSSNKMETPGPGSNGGCNDRNGPSSGCGRNAPTNEGDSSGGCAVAPMPLGGWELFALFVVLARRRDGMQTE
jgi:hypothetical protein